ncbi:peptidase M20 [Cryobacterium roopkundense]|uniref:Glutamate carboxypeptidase n=1 Tax=Cryobacterium roopkundense TaxID=1001240 RepID=A0A099JMQ4_9MICO|nr:M20 family metallopeptidase [Cryobacterium roopkundense]KGJ79415.1 peptidase M20 [Cryobacterium roopkundense]MBB5639861.1 glutamate carboxypeptidase [Cryobacterium roopkundense]
MPDLIHTAEAHQTDILTDVHDLVGIESHSYDKSGLDRGLAHIDTLVRKHLGEPGESIRSDGGALGDVLRLTYPGTGSGAVLVIAHYDTVWPTGTLAGWPVSSQTDAAGRSIETGPGIFDMKTGLVQGIWALKLLRESGKAYPTVTFLFNGDEEIGSLVSRPIIEEAARAADAVLVLEPTSDGAVKTGRKGVGIFKATATGVEAHAGLNPADGASAIHALAAFVTAVSGIADPDRGTTINVGLISGGSGTNVVAGTAVADIDIRIEDPAEMARVDAAFDAVESADPRVTITVDHGWNRPPMSLTAPGERLLAVVQQSAADLGVELENVDVGGGSDANFVSALGVPVLCGMGAVGHGAHARHEFIYPDAIPLYTAITAGTLARLADGLAV